MEVNDYIDKVIKERIQFLTDEIEENEANIDHFKTTINAFKDNIKKYNAEIKHLKTRAYSES